MEYGWWEKNEARGSTRDELQERCRTAKGAIPLLVWSPDSTGTVTDREVDDLQPIVRERECSKALKNVALAGLGFLAWSWVLAKRVESDRAWSGALVMWLSVGLIPLATGVVRWHRLQSAAVPTPPDERERARFSAWLARQSSPGTWTLLITVGFIALVAMVTGNNEAIAKAGLNKTAAWSGEWWRLATGPWLHLNMVHLMFNATALYSLGRVVESVFGWRWLVVTLAIALATGALASACWLSVTSVGFSGAILGLLGFQAGVVCRCPQALPPGSLKSCGITLALLALLGVAGAQIIDNAAHFGGVAAGAWLGWASMAGSKTEIGEPKPIWVGVAGLVLGGSALWTLWVITTR